MINTPKCGTHYVTSIPTHNSKAPSINTLAVTQLQLKELKTETKASNSFNFKGNKVQFEFNTRLFGVVEAASENILKGNYSAANYRA